MADLELNISEALTMLGKLTDEASQQSTLHASQTPALAASSAGRDFMDRGAMFASLLSLGNTVRPHGGGFSMPTQAFWEPNAPRYEAARHNGSS